MKTNSQFLLLSFAALTPAAYIPHAQPKCKEVTLSIKASAQNWDLPAYPNATDKGSLVNYVTQTLPASKFPTKPKKTVSGTYNIAATFCEPVNKVASREKSIQFMLHGFGYTRTYWSGLNFTNPDYDGQYSWVQHATSLGYSTLSIDNLGNGESDHPDPISVVQAPLQIQIILNIFKHLRAGTLSSCPKKFSKIIMVTHSYGSQRGRELLISHPTDAADAYILTASSANLVGLNTLLKTAATGSASAYDPERLGKLAPGYIGVDSKALKDVVYPLDCEFDPELLAHDMKDTHTFAVGELASPNQNITSNFTGPVMILTGRQDTLVCSEQGNNTAVVADCGVGKDSNPGRAVEMYPKAQFAVYVPDRTGHHANLGYSAGEVFGAAHAFLEGKGF